MQIYKTTNLIDGKIYIGKDENDKPNYLGSGMYFKRAVKKYGRENFSKDVIDYGENRKDLCLKEIGWIKHFRELGLELYNICDGGEGFTGKHTAETKKKIGEAREGEKNPMYNKRHSEASLVKMSEARAGEKNPNFGKPLHAEHKRKIGEANKGEKNGMYGMTGEKHPMYGKRGELSPLYGKKRPDVSEMNRRQIGQNNPMSKTNRERRRCKTCQ